MENKQLKRPVVAGALLAAALIVFVAAWWGVFLTADSPPLGNSLAEFVYVCDGDVYTLPTPVSEYLANGWVLEQPPAPVMPAMEHLREWAAQFPASETQRLESGEEQDIYLSRGEKGGMLRIANPADKPAALRDCVVIEIQSNTAYDMNVELAGDICLDSWFGEFKARLEELAGPDAEITRTTSNDYDTFIVRYPDGGYYRFSWLTLYGASLSSLIIHHPTASCTSAK